MDLTGKWFMSFDEDGNVNNQGEITQKENDDLYLVQLYEWLFGSATNQKLVQSKDMITWEFFDNAEDMRARYTDYHLPRMTGR